MALYIVSFVKYIFFIFKIKDTIVYKVLAFKICAVKKHIYAQVKRAAPGSVLSWLIAIKIGEWGWRII